MDPTPRPMEIPNFRKETMYDFIHPEMVYFLSISSLVSLSTGRGNKSINDARKILCIITIFLCIGE